MNIEVYGLPEHKERKSKTQSTMPNVCRLLCGVCHCCVCNLS